MKKCKITVLKKNFDAKLAAQYANPNFGVCGLHQEGQVFYSDWRKPEGLCEEAWKAMHHYVMTLIHGGEDFFNGGWVKDGNSAICCCNDGLRPVVFKLEAVDNPTADAK